MLKYYRLFGDIIKVTDSNEDRVFFSYSELSELTKVMILKETFDEFIIKGHLHELEPWEEAQLLLSGA
jgi:hypothetical protein